MSEAQLKKEWCRQCNIHDRGVDTLPLGHDTIYFAQRRLDLVEAEQTRRGFETGSDWDEM
jgi:hypothetical protein